MGDDGGEARVGPRGRWWELWGLGAKGPSRDRPFLAGGSTGWRWGLAEGGGHPAGLSPSQPMPWEPPYLRCRGHQEPLGEQGLGSYSSCQGGAGGGRSSPPSFSSPALISCLCSPRAFLQHRQTLHASPAPLPRSPFARYCEIPPCDPPQHRAGGCVCSGCFAGCLEGSAVARYLLPSAPNTDPSLLSPAERCFAAVL